MKDIRQKLAAVFQTEAKDHLLRIRAILEKDGVATTGANLDEVFRRAHSLKGAARAVDLRTVENLAHPLESLFSMIRKGDVKLDAPIIKTIHLVLDSIDEGVASVAAGQTPPEPEQALRAIALVLGEKPEPGHAPQAEPPARPVPAPAPAVSAAPAAPAAAPAPRSAEVPVLKARTRTEFETVRVSTAVVDRLQRSAGQMTTETLRQDIVTRQLNRLTRQIGEMAREWDAVKRTISVPAQAPGAPPELAHISRCAANTELRLRELTRETRALSALQKRSVWALRNLGEQIQQDVNGARVVSAENIFDGFGKMMRDLARDEGKEIDFRVSGMEAEADRQVLQALKDPLMHLLRNSLDHGIESPAERKTKGKSPSGAIALQLENRGSRLIVVVEDDGRGVDLNRVLEVALRNGMLTQADAALLSPREQMHLIFHPGFSTARTVTELSGRGMGLNIVTEAAAKLQGTVSVEPREGAGTRFIISVPISISRSRLLLVKCQGRTFAIPAHAIERLHRIKPADVVSIEGRPALSIQRKTLPLASLAHLLKIGDPAIFTDGDTRAAPVVILKSGEKRAGVAVDELLSELEGVVKPLSPMVVKAGKLSGGVLLGDGSVVLVLNTVELVDAFQNLDRTPLAKASAAPVKAERTPTILVVDDSITTRTLEKSILEAHGYNVVVAVDGVEALAVLRSTAVDMVVSDVEMPRMDGFMLLQEIKKDAKFSKLPVIMVTSLEKREDKERGMALGADGYIVKRKFDQKELLDAVRQVV